MKVSLARLDNLVLDARRRWGSRGGAPKSGERVFNFSRFIGESPRGLRALVSFEPASLIADAQRGRSRFFNPTGASLEIARALNQLGCEVDMVGYYDCDFVPDREYDIFVGHGNSNWRQIVEKLPKRALRVNYATGCYWRDFEKQTEVSYARFCESRGIARETLSVCRKIDDEEDSTTQADLVICLGEETAKTFRPVARRVVPINNAAYLDQARLPEAKNWEVAQRHFLYYGGTGNIQKGVDLLIEAFAEEAGCHLHLYTPLEPEILRAYRRELAAPNIHYARHLRFFRGGLSALLRRCAFTLLCGSFATGQSTALLGCLGYGLIPVVNREADLPFRIPGALIEKNDVSSVRAAIVQASGISLGDLEGAARITREAFQKYFVPDAFRNSFKAAVETAFK